MTRTRARSGFQRAIVTIWTVLARYSLAIISRARSLRFRLAAWLAGGHVVIGKGVRFHHPTRFRGRGTLILEDGVALGFPLAGAQGDPILLEPREPSSVIRIGSRTTIVNGTDIVAVERIDIGRRCRIGSRCTIVDSDFHGLAPHQRDTPGIPEPVMIGDNVWFGIEVIVLKGVTVGDDSVAGARAVVTRDVPPGAVVVSPGADIVGNVHTIDNGIDHS